MDKDNEELNYYYPTNDLVTGPDILFFWVARMIISAYDYILRILSLPLTNVHLKCTNPVAEQFPKLFAIKTGLEPVLISYITSL